MISMVKNHTLHLLTDPMCFHIQMNTTLLISADEARRTKQSCGSQCLRLHTD